MLFDADGAVRLLFLCVSCSNDLGMWPRDFDDLGGLGGGGNGSDGNVRATPDDLLAWYIRGSCICKYLFLVKDLMVVGPAIAWHDVGLTMSEGR